jgi:hypothetical protein
MLDID